MGPDKSSNLIDRMPSTPLFSPSASFLTTSPSAPPCSPYTSPLCSPAPRLVGGVTLRTAATRHLSHLDPWRRHSWEPAAVALQKQPGEPCSDLRRYPILLATGEGGTCESGRPGPRGDGDGPGGCPGPAESSPPEDPHHPGGLLVLTVRGGGGPDLPQHFSVLEEQANQLQGCSASAPTLSGQQSTPPGGLAPRPRPRSKCYEALPHHRNGGSTQSVDQLMLGREGSWTDLDREEDREDRNGNPLERTLGFLCKMAGRSSFKNKEKERMREREKEAREREARYSNGHLFTSLTVSGTTLCSACNKSITAKEALSCPTCNVTIHNRCRDTLSDCAKMKQRQQKMALMRNNSALQNVTLRNKTPLMRERPSSAIYPSDSLRQSLLGSRRGRSGLSLSKSISTNNIAGNLNDDSPLGLRRILSQSTDSLNFRNRAMSMESLNDDGEAYYASMLEEMEIEGRDFEADSWSMAVDSSYLQTHRKDVIKRQDVIYELIQTELHHVRTLRIMDRVFRQGMLEEVQLEQGLVQAMFPCLDRLMALHAHFLAQLLLRRNHSLQANSTYNFTIHQLGDVLLEQFSGHHADEMRKTYAEFCSRHLKAVKQYKELLARDKRFQLFIRRVSRGPLLRRHGVQECILLVTQRITKYPVLIQRILDNTKDSEEEASSLAQALALVRELLCSVDQQVLELERTQRLQEIRARLDPRAEAKVRDGRLFRAGELLRRRLIHEGTLLWKNPGSRLKDVHVLLMTDILVFLQEKDQRYIFPCLDKPPVLSLQNLILRDIANQERGMFLISDSSPPEMYEVHAASKEDKNNWIRAIQQAVSGCPLREEFPLIETEYNALLRRLKADIQQKDREVLELLQERVTLFSDLAEVMWGQEVTLPHNSHNLFRADTPQAPRGEKLLMDAIAEVDRLGELLLGSSVEIPLPSSLNSHLIINGQEVVVNGAHDIPATQGVVIKQDSILELSLRPEGSVSPCTPTGGRPWRSLSRDAGVAEASTGTALGELALLQRQHSLLQEELNRLRGSDGRLKDSEKARAQLERQVRDMKTTATVDGPGAGGLQQTAPLAQGSKAGHGAGKRPAVQSEALQECSDTEVDVTSEEDDGRVSPRSESPRDNEAINTRWREHFQKLLNRNTTADLEVINQISQRPVRGGMEEPPSVAEAQDAVRSLKNNKAARPDGIAAEILKGVGQELLHHIHALLLKIWGKEILSNYGFPDKFVGMLRLLHDDMSVPVLSNSGSESESFTVETGQTGLHHRAYSVCHLHCCHPPISQDLPQGIQVLYLNRFKDKSKVLTTTILELQYVDDKDNVVEHFADDLQCTLNAFAKACRLLGLSLNIKKTRPTSTITQQASYSTHNKGGPFHP
ncbi:rho guanine nucleotide exchange factor 2-like [Aplochiton taeniatus]